RARRIGAQRGCSRIPSYSSSAYVSTPPGRIEGWLWQTYRTRRSAIVCACRVAGELENRADLIAQGDRPATFEIGPDVLGFLDQPKARTGDDQIVDAARPCRLQLRGSITSRG